MFRAETSDIHRASFDQDIQTPELTLHNVPGKNTSQLFNLIVIKYHNPKTRFAHTTEDVSVEYDRVAWL